MLIGAYEQALHCSTKEQLKLAAQNYADRHNYGSFTLMGVTDETNGTSTFRSIESIPKSYDKLYRDLGRARSDPVMQHCKRRLTPVAWNRSTYALNGMEETWNTMSSCGLASGVAVAMHLPGGRHIFVGFDTPAQLTWLVDSEFKLLQSLCLFASCIAEPASVLLCKYSEGSDIIDIT